MSLSIAAGSSYTEEIMSSNKSISDKLSNQKSALYVRVSTQYQIDKDSLPVQREDLINYSKYALGVDNYEIFEDAGYSAKNTDRPAFQQMMSRLRTGEFSHLVVWKIDRISRNLLDFAEMYAEIKKLGITFVSKNEQFDTSSAMGEAMLKIILVFAELERNMTSERVSAVLISRATNGQWNGGRIPFGYNYNKETSEFTINESEASVIRSIYDAYEQEHSLLRVAKMFNEKGIFPRSGIPWNPTTIGTMLKNPFYTGSYRYNYHDESKSGGNTSTKHLKSKEDWIIVKNHHPAIIPEERQQHVLSILENNRRSNSRSSKAYSRKNTHVFAGLLFCGYCGKQMQSTIDRPRSDGYRPSIYACSRKRRFNDCANKYISDITVGPFVLNYIANVIKAQNNFGKSTPIETFERKLLRGTIFDDVKHIERVGLQDMYDMLRAGVSGSVYTSKTVSSVDENKDLADERDLLSAEKRKKERALSRLKSLYLYTDDSISEREFLTEKKSIIDSIKTIDSRLEEIEKNSSRQFTLTDEEFMAKASMFIMTQQLQEKRFIDFEKLIRKIDPKIIKEFVNSVIQKIVIKDGKVISIRFKNGLEHKFLYKGTE